MTPRNRRSYFSDALDELDNVAPKYGSLDLSSDSPPESDSDTEAQVTAPRRRPWCQSIQRHWGKMLIGILTLAAWISYRSAVVGHISRGLGNWSLLGRVEGAHHKLQYDMTPVLQDPWAVCDDYHLSPDDSSSTHLSESDAKAKEYYDCAEMVLRHFVQTGKDRYRTERTRRLREGQAANEEMKEWLNTIFDKLIEENREESCISNVKEIVANGSFPMEGRLADTMAKLYCTRNPNYKPQRELERSWVSRVGNFVGNWTMRNPFGAAGMNTSSKQETVPEELLEKIKSDFGDGPHTLWGSGDPRPFLKRHGLGDIQWEPSFPFLSRHVRDMIHSNEVYPKLEDQVEAHIALESTFLRNADHRACFADDTRREVAPHLEELRQDPDRSTKLVQILSSMADTRLDSECGGETINYWPLFSLAEVERMSEDELKELVAEKVQVFNSIIDDFNSAMNTAMVREQVLGGRPQSSLRRLRRERRMSFRVE